MNDNKLDQVPVPLPRASKAVYYTVEVHNFDLQEKTTRNNNNTITAK